MESEEPEAELPGEEPEPTNYWKIKIESKKLPNSKKKRLKRFLNT